MLSVLLIVCRTVHTSAHQNKVESLDLLQVRGHAMLAHFTLKCLPVRQFIFLKTSAQTRTPTPYPDQVPLIDCFADVQHFDNFASLIIDWRFLLKHDLSAHRLWLLLSYHHWRFMHGLRVACVHGGVICVVCRCSCAGYKLSQRKCALTLRAHLTLLVSHGL